MYGQIHLPIKDMVLDKYGGQIWKKILEECGLDNETDFLVFQPYPDDKTYSLLNAVSTVTNESWDTVLENFGEYFIQYCLRHGYDQLLRILGNDFISFIQNLDTLHSHLARTYTELRFPSFRCERKDKNTVYLHYLTERKHLQSLVLGLTKAASRLIYNQTLEMKIESIRTIQTDDNKTEREHVTYIVELQETAQHQNEVQMYHEPESSDCILTSNHICKALPYHIIFDEYLKIKQVGNLAKRLIGQNIEEQTRFMPKIFTIIHPPMKFNIENMKLYSNNIFYLSMKTNSKMKQLVLRGEMKWLPEIKHMFYICSPQLTSLGELTTLNMFISDLPLYDVTRDLILLNQQRIAEIDIAKKLSATTAELTRTSRLLEEEKKKTDDLLFRMLPQKVANGLKNGYTIAAEKFENVTVLFSDIVSFTTIASSCSPMHVVNMLNDLYERFDNKTSEHNIYKVETIGDAYMVVNGCPDVKDVHAEGIAEFAIDMIKEAKHVQSPATGKPLQIRVGFHSGPVVAGVVGVKMPRYCLFGDTVNTASRMESHGIPGRIHISSSSFRLLLHRKFLFRNRGFIDVKGKGTINTYFLVGESDKVLEEPDDRFANLPLIPTEGTDEHAHRKNNSVESGSQNTTSTYVEVGVEDCQPRAKENGADKDEKQRSLSRTCTLC